MRVVALRHTAVPALAAALLAGHAAAQAPVPAPSTSPDRGWAVPAGPLAPAPIPREEFAARRRALAGQMGDGVLVAMGAEEPSASWSAFAQEPEFRYLTGYDEPGALLVIRKQGDQVSERLYVMPRDPTSEIWNGARIGAEGATRMTGIPAYDVERMPAALDSLLRGATTLYTLTPERARGWQSPEQQFIQALRGQQSGIRQVTDLSDRLRTMRQRKSPAEIDMLRRAIHITSLAQREAMRATEPGMNEFEVHALIEGTFRRYGSERPAFGSIVASGPNSTTLHYRTADRYMQAGEALVMDIGASYNGYSADVTRTIPVGGRFTPEQRAIYELVLAAQKAAEAEARPGVTMGRLNQAASAVMSQGLVRLGLMDSDTATYDCERGGAVRTCPQLFLYYMHAIGHGIGLDVHDPEIGYTAGFAVGSAFTLEPGIYVRADALDYLPDTPRNRAFRERVRGALQRYRNIGVRIEDDYFFTEQGLERASVGAPREIAEIEALMNEESLWNRERRPEMVEWYRGVHPR
ncbi:aminopeptidase P N-terminal domain-containing protein [Longimicrobium sp.]|uniref:aminopeptidase P N-terminal domain-containing protein n=1 Tax=Longimicrobium sp. TaxID=2029185 RepID=UPI002E3081EC|nr:aminopeptidase P N-terminal domain-containing protein [Longimicrobium sp.]HEX6040170.1 aminopeptidase P N-terminal domain-containing protein [Longimicrobium sp.]